LASKIHVNQFNSMESSIRGEIQCIICRSSWGNDNWRYWSFEKYANNARGLAVLFLFLEYTLHTCTKNDRRRHR
jgi:hypothetical protein